MQPQLTSRISGTVVNVKQVDVDARPAIDGRRGYEAFSYAEVTLATADCVLDGDVCDGLLVYPVIRCDVDDPALGNLAPGVAVAVLVTHFVDVYRASGKYMNKPGFRLVRADVVAASRAA